MEHAELNGRCIELFERPRVRNHMWNARMFWELGKAHTYTRDDLIHPKVDLCELEVLLSAAAY